MIKLIGFKRTFFLVCALMANLALLGIYFLSIGPMLDGAETQMNAVNNQIKDFHAKIGSVKTDMDFVRDNLPKYNDLKDKGFFMSQDRFMIGHTLEDLRVKSGISSFSFSVADVAEIPNADAAAINYQLINSHIKVDKIVSPLDSNIYIFAQEMSHAFPSYVRIQNMEITRAAEVNETTLKDISDGKPVNFVNASLEYDWITMVQKSPESTTGPGGTPAGFRRQ